MGQQVRVVCLCTPLNSPNLRSAEAAGVWCSRGGGLNVGVTVITGLPIEWYYQSLKKSCMSCILEGSEVWTSVNLVKSILLRAVEGVGCGEIM